MFTKFTFSALLSIIAVPAMAATCDVTIEGDDLGRFNIKEIVVDKTCDDFTINLVHVGRFPKSHMGHNVVITKAVDRQGVIADGFRAGLVNNNIKPDDDRVITHTAKVGGGEKTAVTFKTAALDAGGDYEFFNSDMIHWKRMSGKVIVK